MKTCSIYTLEHPVTGEIRYVGRTTTSIAKRVSRHVYEARLSKSKSRRSINWIKSLLKDNLRPVISEIDVCSLEDRKIIESYWIQQFKSWGFNLINHRIYDDSDIRSCSYEELHGVDQARLIREKISRNHASKKDGYVSPMKGVIKSKDWVDKISKTLTGRKHEINYFRDGRYVVVLDSLGNSVKEYTNYEDIFNDYPSFSKGGLKSSLTKKRTYKGINIMYKYKSI